MCVGPLVGLPCLTQPPTKSYGMAPTQRHITSKRSGKARRSKLVCAMCTALAKGVTVIPIRRTAPFPADISCDYRTFPRATAAGQPFTGIPLICSCAALQGLLQSLCGVCISHAMHGFRVGHCGTLFKGQLFLPTSILKKADQVKTVIKLRQEMTKLTKTSKEP